MNDKVKKQIDTMSYYELCYLWRFGTLNDTRLQGECGAYVKKRLFDHFGGFTPEISKELGWETK